MSCPDKTNYAVLMGGASGGDHLFGEHLHDEELQLAREAVGQQRRLLVDDLLRQRKLVRCHERRVQRRELVPVNSAEYVVLDISGSYY